MFLATALLICVLTGGGPTKPGLITAIAGVAILAAQLAVVRPRLTRRSNRILAGADAPRSHVYHTYIAAGGAVAGPRPR